ncbi:dienelactone hydrolase family protein [Pseudomonas sp. BN606]|jgi:dienelactone hydrolase|uniref:dienelactone hydrolase family protein n=1 Tax=unclassified Pseudomonas TaxID=196821 RepID=UPI0024572CEE|nr:dienelactone hydrolase family protein [Pseudomonas sp. BN606]MDH4652866.1 dienelactone hydrolase family protein [Pseudomonas sp. BN606]
MTQIQSRSLGYTVDGLAFEGCLLFDAADMAPRPGLLMAPNWFGVSDGARELASQVAGRGFRVLLVDIYGATVRPASTAEASAAMLPLKQDRALLRRRLLVALDALRSQELAPADGTRLAAFGFCFGGTCALELARAGAPLKAAVSFHGALDTPNPDDARNIQGAVLVLDGAQDPLVPREQLPTFAREMGEAGVDWQLLSFGGAVHSFTDPAANNPGTAQYNEKVSRRAFTAMYALLDEVFV